MSEQPVKTGKKLTATQIILIAGIVLILAVVIVVGVLVLKRGQPMQPVGTAPGNGNLVVDETTEDIVGELQKQIDEGLYQVKMTPTWHFPDGTRELSSDAYVANVTANTKPVYFDVKLDDEVLYTSPKIPVGSAVKDIAFEKKLAAGDYECVCTYYLLNEDDTVFSSTSVVLRLQVAQ